MAGRGTAFSRTMAYFREADIDEAKAALSSAMTIVEQRTPLVAPPRQRRPRRMKSQMKAGAAVEPGPMLKAALEG